MSARARRDALWAQVAADPYPGPLPTQSPLELLQGLARTPDKNDFLTEALRHEADTLPPSREDPALPRPKIFHGCGTVACVRWVPRETPFTGLLSSGGPGLLRASSTHSEVASPGIGLKLFPEHGPSRNLVAMVRLEGIGRRAGFFDQPLTTSVPAPRIRPITFPCEEFYRWVALKGTFDAAMAWLYTAEAPPSPLVIPLHELAGTGPDGAAVPDPVVPQALTFHAPASLRAACPGAEDLRLELGALPVGTVLYEVRGDGLPIGEVVSESAFVASVFGDERLFFRHPLPPGSRTVP